MNFWDKISSFFLSIKGYNDEVNDFIDNQKGKIDEIADKKSKASLTSLLGVIGAFGGLGVIYLVSEFTHLNIWGLTTFLPILLMSSAIFTAKAFNYLMTDERGTENYERNIAELNKLINSKKQEINYLPSSTPKDYIDKCWDDLRVLQNRKMDLTLIRSNKLIIGQVESEEIRLSFHNQIVGIKESFNKEIKNVVSHYDKNLENIKEGISELEKSYKENIEKINIAHIDKIDEIEIEKHEDLESLKLSFKEEVKRIKIDLQEEIQKVVINKA